MIFRNEVEKCSELGHKIKKLIEKKELKDDKVAENRRHSLNRTDELENKVDYSKRHHWVHFKKQKLISVQYFYHDSTIMLKRTYPILFNSVMFLKIHKTLVNKEALSHWRHNISHHKDPIYFIERTPSFKKKFQR